MDQHPTTTARAAHDGPAMPETVYRHLLELHAQVVFAVGPDCRIVRLSEGWEMLSGREVASGIGMPFGELLRRDRAEPETDADLDALLANPRQIRRLTRSDGSTRSVEIAVQASPSPDGATAAIGTMTDVTERDLDELQLRHRQKLEAVGRLAAGIAHEINTPIQFIGDNLNFLSESFERVVGLLDRYRAALGSESGHLAWEERVAMLRSAEDQADMEFVTSEVPEAVQSALEGAQRVASIVRAMKAFDHPDGAEPQAIDLNAVITNTLVVSRNELKYVAEVETHLGELPTLAGSPGDLGQVFLNLFINAADAIANQVEPHGERGRMAVTSRSLGDTVLVTVSDTGGGIPDELADRVFEPFFTTKEAGRGTGQGLPLARALVSRHGGSIRFESEPSGGTTFTVELPVRAPG